MTERAEPTGRTPLARTCRRLAAVLAASVLTATACGASNSPLAARRSPATRSPSTTSSTTTTSSSTTTRTAPATTTTSPSTTTAPSAGAARPSLRWSACRGGQGPSGFQCATLRVPLDYADPGKGTIGIALDRRPAPGPALGSLLVNPGGPGVSGVDFLPQAVSELQPTVLRHFNIVGFDPRGVDRSDPVVCGNSRQLQAELSVNPAPTTNAGWTTMLAAERAFARGCAARSGAILPYVGTRNAARDLDRIRAAVGDPKLNYLGFSYGTELGAVYAQLYPTHIRAMVLDGALDPAVSSVDMVDTQSTALYGQLQAFFHSCAAGNCGWDPAGGPAAAFRRLLAQVTAHPEAVSGSTQRVGPAALLYATAAALYSPQTWSFLGQALNALAGGDGTYVLELFDSYLGRSGNGQYSNQVEAETAINCADAPVPSIGAIRADGAKAFRDASYFGLLDLYSDTTCDLWPYKPAHGLGAVHADGSPPIVVVGSTHDPITPYAWARALAHQLQHGVLLTRNGYGHTAYSFSSCIRTRVDDYLVALRVPPAGTTCPSGG